MYLKLPDTYPYSLADFRSDNPQVSVRDNPSDETLAEFGLVPVQPAIQPTVDYTLNVVAQTPRLIDGEWVEAWALEAASDEQIAERTAEAATQTRTLRNSELQASDWWVIQAAETGAQLSAEKLSYRQTLRDVTAQSGFPFNIIWPTKP